MKRVNSMLTDTGGSVAVTMVILMFVFGGFLAVVIDMAHVQTVKNELANAADAAALAGARALMPLTPPAGYTEPPYPMEVNDSVCAAARQAAIDTSQSNKVNPGESSDTKQNVYLNPAEVITGHWNFIPVGNRAGTFNPNCDVSQTNAVQVMARIMNADLNQGSVVITLAQKLFGVTVRPSAIAIAAVGNLQTLPKGSGGGFLAGDHDFLKKAYDNWKAGNTEQKYYLVLGPAGGQTSYQYADNGSWALPSGTYQSFNPTLNDYIDAGTKTDISVGNNVDLKNGEMSNAMINLQKEVDAAKASGETGLDSAVVGVYSDELGASVGDAWNEKSTLINSFFEIEITNAWKSSELNKVPDVQSIIDGMYDENQQKNLVGVIEFTMKGPWSFGGEGGSGLPSNTYGFIVKLVDNEAFGY